MTDSRGCEHEGTKVVTASNRLNGVADPEGATLASTLTSTVSVIKYTNTLQIYITASCTQEVVYQHNLIE